jgi:type IV pilus assembly protein PilQ
VINTNGAYESMAYQTGTNTWSRSRPSAVQWSRAPGVRRPRNAGQFATIGGTGRYVGKPVTFNFQDVPVRTVLQLIAEESGLNIVVADTVGGSVTLRLINVPWDQALEIVLRAKGLDQRRDGNVVWVAPQAELSAYELAQANSRIALENSGEIVVEYIPINYGSAVDLVDIIRGNNQGSSGGSSGGGGGGAGIRRPDAWLALRARHGERRRAHQHAAGQRYAQEDRRGQEDAGRARPARRPGADRSPHRDRRRHLRRELGARLGISNPNVNSDSVSNISGNIEANQATSTPSSTCSTAAREPDHHPGFLTNLGVTGAAGSIAYSICAAAACSTSNSRRCRRKAVARSCPTARDHHQPA